MGKTEYENGITIDRITWGKGRRYVAYLPNGRKNYLQNVTSITGILDKPALIPWAVGMTNDAWLEQLEPDRPYTYEEFEEIAEYAKRAHFRKREEAAEWGTRAHAIIEQFLRTGEWPDLTMEDVEVQNSCELWINWWNSEDLQVLQVEQYIADLKLGIGGTADAVLVNSAGEVIIYDWKTGKGVYPEAKLQLAAYSGMLEFCGIGFPSYGIIARIGRDSAHMERVKISQQDLRSLHEHFKNLVPLANWLRAEDRKRYDRWKNKR
jgi:hypothetical protein